MFKKKKCLNCKEKTKEDYEFCPHCGSPFNEKENQYLGEDFGMLGKNDFMNSENEIRLPMGFNMIFNSLMKSLDEQFKEFDKGIKTENKKGRRNARNGISISISSSTGRPPEIMVQSFGNAPDVRERNSTRNQKSKALPSILFSEDKQRKFKSFTKEEPKTNVRRLSNKVIYEINMPGVKTLEEVSIMRLESSIEIKAVSENKAYYKIIPINIPIKSYKVEKENLILELEH